MNLGGLLKSSKSFSGVITWF